MRHPDAAGPPPIRAARARRSRPGFVFLDAALPEPGAISLLGADPRRILRGTSRDVRILEEALEVGRGAASWEDGGLVGWLSFDGAFCFGEYEHFFVFDHDAACWLGDAPPADLADVAGTAPIPDFRTDIDREDFIHAIRRVQKFIAAGDIYQACLSHPLRCGFTGDAFPFYEALRRVSPAPQAAFLDLDGIQIASSSPELFLRVEGRNIVTRPIKGTRRRRVGCADDDRAALELGASPKETAELVMITDLERNDLGRICEWGSIETPDLLRIEKFSHVHHLVSTVRGRLRAGVSHPEALVACSPGGSISGAPKRRALEIIQELEMWRRGLYTGALGVFGFHGASRFSIAIRTAVFQDGMGEFGVGAGIVADSDPALEWQETLDKAAGLLEACAGMRLPSRI